MIDRRDFLAFGVAAASAPIAAAGAFAQTAPQAAGSVASLRGEVRAQRRSEVRMLQSGQQVFVGERLQTSVESRLHAALGPATNLYMGENTGVMIDRHIVRRGGVIHLSTGGIVFDRKSPDPKPPVVIRSPYASIAVRGTTVFAGPSLGVFGVFVEDGLAIVKTTHGDVTLRAGEGTNIATPGGAPSRAIKWGAGRIAGAMRSVK
ncbi:MAG: FecR domain-containing protein [Alphaproteobacteria bacterium]|nr:FecR domain-containing protein [Alphaproteobacteria bacterium]